MRARVALAGSLAYGEWRWQEAERVLDRAIELTPSSAYPYASRANLRVVLGRFDEAFADHDRAEQLEPLSAEWIRDRGYLLNWAGRPAEALRAFQRLARVDTSDLGRGLLWYVAPAYYRSGQRVKAESLYRSFGDTTGMLLARGDRAEMLARLRVLETRYAGSCRRLPASLLPLYRELGLTERRLDCLEELVNTRQRWIGFFLRQAGLDSAIAANPRYRRLMQRVGLAILPPEPSRASEPPTPARDASRR